MPGDEVFGTVYVKGSLLDCFMVPDKDDELRGAFRLAGDAQEAGMRSGEFQDSILRDLSWLFNAVSPLGLNDTEMRRKYPRTAASVLGYGLRGVLGHVVQDPAEIERHVED